LSISLVVEGTQTAEASPGFGGSTTSKDTSNVDGGQRSLDEDLLVTEATAVDLDVVTIGLVTSSNVPAGNNTGGGADLRARETSRSEGLWIGLGAGSTGGDRDGGWYGVDTLVINSVDADGVGG